MKNQFEKIKSMSLIEFKDFLLGMKIDGTGCGNCVLRDKYCNSIAEEACETNILNWLNSKTDMTADDMFEELGYRKVKGENPYWIEYHREEREENNYEGEIINIKFDGEYYYKTNRNNKNGVGISETEDKAIHKKIEELKNG